MLNSPATIRLCTHWWLGLKRRVWPHIATRPVCFCSCDHRLRRPPASRRAGSRPARACRPSGRRCACAACICVGVHRITASTSGSARLSARSVVTCADAVLVARPPRSCRSSRPTSETTSTPSMFLMPSRCLMPKAPAPASATLMVLLVIASCSPGSDGRRPCCWRARDRSGARPWASGRRPTSAIAPRAISHITSSMPSLPASRT